ncbi:MAG: amidohydrolase family protein [Lachnospiraceae bacterium]|nr:amidohydrolase family protein [Lachnospiraceae bacterium]
MTKKVDLHMHIMTTVNLPKLGKFHLSGPKAMLAHMEKLGIKKAVLMSTGEKKAPLGNNRICKKICEKYPDKFSWMCMLDAVDEATVYDRLLSYKAQGAIGVGELTINRPLNDSFLQAVFAAAEKLSLPVTLHMSPEVGYKYGVVDNPGLPLLEEVLKQYPNLKVLGHSQVFWIEISGDAPTDNEGRSAWGQGPVVPGGRVPELFEKYQNLYGDLSANSAGQAIMRDAEFGLKFLENYADRLFFATDMVNADMVFPLGKWLDEQADAGKLSREAYEKICWGNAGDLFGM